MTSTGLELLQWLQDLVSACFAVLKKAILKKTQVMQLLFLLAVVIRVEVVRNKISTSPDEPLVSVDSS